MGNEEGVEKDGAKKRKKNRKEGAVKMYSGQGWERNGMWERRK